MARCRVGKCTPDQAGQAWNSGFQGGAAQAKAGAQNPRRSWSQQLVAQRNTIVSGINQAFTPGGAWERGVTATGDAGWQAGFLDKGIRNMQAGSAKGAQHYAAFRAQWDPAVQAAVQSLPARGSYEENKSRSGAMQDWLHSQKGRYRKLWRRGIGG